MDITRVVVRPVEMDKVKAMVSVTFDDSFVVHGIRVVDGEKGLFVAMPSRRLPSGEYRDVAHPINTETREMIQTAVLKEFEQIQGEVKEAKEEPEAKAEPEPAVDTEAASEAQESTEDETGASGEAVAEAEEKVEEAEAEDAVVEEQPEAEEKKEE